MTTMTIQYDNRNRTVTKLLNGLLHSGIIWVEQPKMTAKEKHIENFKSALRETEAMAKDIAINGIAGYKTLDDLLNEED